MGPSPGRTGAAAGHRNRRASASPDSARVTARRLRVLWLIKGLGPGGAERLLVSAAGAHDHARFELHVAYVVPAKDHLVPALSSAGVEVHPLGIVGDRPYSWIRRLRRLLRTGAYDVVHLHSPLVAGVARLLARTLPRRARPRIVTTEHNAWSTFALPTRILNALTWHLDDAHLAVSEEVRSSVRPRRSADATEVVVHGVDVRALILARSERAQARSALGVDEAEALIGTVANYRAQKAYPDLLTAARAVLDVDPRVRFVAVGQGPLEAEIHALHERLALGDRFTLLGYRADPEAVLAACDVFVLASHFEGYPIALMEALGIGLPVVATAVGGVPDAVRDGVEGLLVPPGRPDLLAEAIVSVAGDGVLRARLAAAAEERGRRYDIVNAVRRTERIYDELTVRGAVAT